MKVVLLLLATVSLVLAECPRKPYPSITRSPKSPGDNGFKIILNGDPERYTPGSIYTVTLVGSRTHNRLQQFTRFSIAASLRDPLAESNPRTHGQFHLFADTISTFDEECINTIIEADDLPKTEVQVMWKAPASGSGCVVIKAMVFENTRKWFAEDGQLSRQICEQTSREAKTPTADNCCACDDAKYSMTFQGLWSKQTHPRDFPLSLWLTHFSDVIGASHEKNFTFWGEGQIASDGFRSLAEWGSVRLMEQELRQQGKHLKSIVKAPGLWHPNVNTNTTAVFKVDRTKHFVSLASMLGPTPDWVVGVNGLNLCLKDCSWVENLTIDLYPWDAGTDSGVTYMSPNTETKPREKMYRITTKYPEDPRAPFYDMTTDEMNPLARLFLTRQSITPRGCDEEQLQEFALETVEDPEASSRPECGVTEYSEWSACSVTCGKGLRMRTREYTMPMEKVKMFGCTRQLVSKEMCVADIPECEGETASNDDDLDQGLALETDNEGICTTDNWGPWSDCSETCGIGFSKRTRHFIDRMGRKKCPQTITEEKKKCMMPECRPEDVEVPIAGCPITPWSDWSTCSSSCGPGVRVRMRMLLVVGQQLHDECSSRVSLMEQAPCTVRESCSLDMATAKQVCMQEADPGLCRGSYQRWAFNTQKLMCVPFNYNGCKGNRNNFLTEQDCTTTCAVVRDAIIGLESGNSPANQFPQSSIFGNRRDCMITDWSAWTPCSVTCGVGTTERFRMIKAEPENGGKSCPRQLNKRRRCSGPPCY